MECYEAATLATIAREIKSDFGWDIGVGHGEKHDWMLITVAKWTQFYGKNTERLVYFRQTLSCGCVFSKPLVVICMHIVI